MSLRKEQCKKVCRILDDVLSNRPTERDSLIVAVQLAFKSLSEPHWIPVTERLPEEDGRYLVCGAKGGIYHANYRGGWWTQVGCGGKLVPSAVAWMPLPEHYKGVTE